MGLDGVPCTLDDLSTASDRTRDYLLAQKKAKLDAGGECHALAVATPVPPVPALAPVSEAIVEPAPTEKADSDVIEIEESQIVPDNQLGLSDSASDAPTLPLGHWAEVDETQAQPSPCTVPLLPADSAVAPAPAAAGPIPSGLDPAAAPGLDPSASKVSPGPNAVEPSDPAGVHAQLSQVMSPAPPAPAAVEPKSGPADLHPPAASELQVVSPTAPAPAAVEPKSGPAGLHPPAASELQVMSPPAPVEPKSDPAGLHPPAEVSPAPEPAAVPDPPASELQSAPEPAAVKSASVPPQQAPAVPAALPVEPAVKQPPKELAATPAAPQAASALAVPAVPAIVAPALAQPAVAAAAQPLRAMAGASSMEGHTGAATTSGMNFADLPEDIRRLVSNGLVIKPPAEKIDGDDDASQHINTSSHENAAMRMNRFMQSKASVKFPHMVALFNGTPEVP